MCCVRVAELPGRGPGGGDAESVAVNLARDATNGWRNGKGRACVDVVFGIPGGPCQYACADRHRAPRSATASKGPKPAQAAWQRQQ
jgi:hypothetical protein